MTRRAYGSGEPHEGDHVPTDGHTRRFAVAYLELVRDDLQRALAPHVRAYVEDVTAILHKHGVGKVLPK